MDNNQQEHFCFYSEESGQTECLVQENGHIPISNGNGKSPVDAMPPDGLKKHARHNHHGIHNVEDKMIRYMDDIFGKFDWVKINCAAYEEELHRYWKRIVNLMTYLKKELTERMILAFLGHPYLVYKTGEENYMLNVIALSDIKAGVLVKANPGIKVFKVNPRTVMLHPVPDVLKDQIHLPELPQVLWEGETLTGDPEALDMVDEFLESREGNCARIKTKHISDVVIKYVKNGIIPHKPKPVYPEDLIAGPYVIHHWNRDQVKAWNLFLEKGWMGLFWPCGGGKTMFALSCVERIKGRFCVVSRYNITLNQWRQYIDDYYHGRYMDRFDFYTYSQWKKVPSIQGKYAVAIYDELHWAPANTHSNWLGLKCKYRIGLSGSPFREDGRDYMMFAMTGPAIGLDDYDEYIRENKIKVPNVTLKICTVNSEENEKKKVTLDLVKNDVKKTIIYVDSLRDGSILAALLKTQFVHGGTNGDRMAKIDYSIKATPYRCCVLSRACDEGIHLPDLDRIIEYGFHKGQRSQEAQRTGRLNHADQKGEYFILMSEEEEEKYSKRLDFFHQKHMLYRTIGAGSSIRSIVTD